MTQATGVFSQAAASSLFRAMRKDEAGRPTCGAQANMLGVRPGVDIVPDAEGAVEPGRRGLSVTPDDPKRLPPHVRPARFGGKGKLPLFELPVAGLGSSLAYRSDPAHPERHGFVEPRVSMHLRAYQLALASTQAAWKEVE